MFSGIKSFVTRSRRMSLTGLIRLFFFIFGRCDLFWQPPKNVFTKRRFSNSRLKLIENDSHF